jgi:hypothetical protein
MGCDAEALDPAAVAVSSLMRTQGEFSAGVGACRNWRRSSCTRPRNHCSSGRVRVAAPGASSCHEDARPPAEEEGDEDEASASACCASGRRKNSEPGSMPKCCAMATRRATAAGTAGGGGGEVASAGAFSRMLPSCWGAPVPDGGAADSSPRFMASAEASWLRCDKGVATLVTLCWNPMRATRLLDCIRTRETQEHRAVRLLPLSDMSTFSLLSSSKQNEQHEATPEVLRMIRPPCKCLPATGLLFVVIDSHSRGEDAVSAVDSPRRSAQIRSIERQNPQSARARSRGADGGVRIGIEGVGLVCVRVPPALAVLHERARSPNDEDAATRRLRPRHSGRGKNQTRCSEARTAVCEPRFPAPPSGARNP